MKTTIELPEELVREIKMKSVLEGRKLKETIAELLRAGLAAESRRTRGTVRRKQSGLPIVKCRHAASPKEELTPERAAEILGRQDTDWYAKTGR
jgi:hypothetical protein